MRNHNWGDVQDEVRAQRARAHCTAGKQRGFEGVERDSVTESFSYAGG